MLCKRYRDDEERGHEHKPKQDTPYDTHYDTVEYADTPRIQGKVRHTGQSRACNRVHYCRYSYDKAAGSRKHGTACQHDAHT